MAVEAHCPARMRVTAVKVPGPSPAPPAAVGTVSPRSPASATAPILSVGQRPWLSTSAACRASTARATDSAIATQGLSARITIATLSQSTGLLWRNGRRPEDRPLLAPVLRALSGELLVAPCRPYRGHEILEPHVAALHPLLAALQRQDLGGQGVLAVHRQHQFPEAIAGLLIEALGGREDAVAEPRRGPHHPEGGGLVRLLGAQPLPHRLADDAGVAAP